MTAMAVSRCLKCTSLSSMWTTEPLSTYMQLHLLVLYTIQPNRWWYRYISNSVKWTSAYLLCLSSRGQHPFAATAQQFCCDLPTQPYAAQSYHPTEVAEGQVEGMITISGQCDQILCLKLCIVHHLLHQAWRPLHFEVLKRSLCIHRKQPHGVSSFRP